MVSWTGKGMPGFMVVGRKPWPKGREYHTIVCNETNVLCNAELYEGAINMKNKEYTDKYMSTAALTLRMSKPWHNQGKVICYDSGFGGIEMVKANLDAGVYVVCQCKGIFSKTPKELVLSKCVNKGDRFAMQTTVVTQKGLQAPVVMIGAKHKKHECMMVSGGMALLADGEERVTKWSVMDEENKKKTLQRVTRRWLVQAWYHKRFSTVDYFNKVCLHPCAIWEIWPTQKWYTRDYAGLFGMALGNHHFATLAFKEGCSKNTNVKSRKLAMKALLTWGVQVESKADTPMQATKVEKNLLEHYQELLPKDHFQLTCSQCDSKARYYCVPCSKLASVYIPVCGSTSNPDCMAQHQAGVCSKRKRHVAIPK